MKHKIPALLGCIFITLCCVLCACGETGQTSEDSERQTIYFASIRSVTESPQEGVNNMTSAFQEAFSKFNAENTSYQVEAKLYSDETSLQLALISGEPIDIIDLYNLSTDAYLARGVLTDLYTFIDQDSELSREDFVPAFLSMAERDGALNFLSMAFSVRTLMAPTELVGEQQGWTVSEFAEVLAAMPETMSVYGSTDASDFFSTYLSYTIDQYVDLDAGTINLRQEDFYTMLALCKEYCGRTNAEDTLLTNVNTIFGVTSFLTYDRDYADAYTLIGYPGADGNGALRYYAAEQLAISTMSTCPDGAWEFLKYLLQCDVDNSIGLPVLQEAFDQAMLDAREDLLNVDGSVSIAGITEEEEAAFRELLDGAVGPGGSASTSKIVSIILEEAAAYFAGDKTADEVIPIMEDRATTYLWEQS